MIRVLIIDDSSLVRSILSKGLSKDSEIEIVGTAPDVYAGRDLIIKTKPDVLTLDIEMPRMDGVEFLRRLMPQYPIPVVVVSSLTKKGKKITLDALDAGAVDYVAKPESDLERGLTGMMEDLISKIKIASRANVSRWKNQNKLRKSKPLSSKVEALSETTDKVIAIGASTGGTEAINQVITSLPATMPGIVIVQHMPKGFTTTFANRLNEISELNVKEAEDGDIVKMGKVFIAPGDFHMRIKRSGGQYIIKIEEGEKVSGHRPSVDVLFESIANQVGPNGYGVILTGMGSDGAKGLKMMRENGAKTLGQNKNSCIVYGMPKVAYEIGAVEKQVDLKLVAHSLINLLRKS
jgi:two-component system chemotaxis response regulator CheB